MYSQSVINTPDSWFALVCDNDQMIAHHPTSEQLLKEVNKSIYKLLIQV